ncbi:hypothetical protein [Bacillus sp. 165]|uniref:hypothetical protein n=1 Tax=Bacillus sp. 165 TaxID=1529117 RepID=UPI001ADB265C|nr:hypothetical protein [Bacillus sp. 165]MBO9129131.1 hypothetical protein [Bacillus sp. 165]
MFSLRGDAHRLYLKLKTTLNKDSHAESMKELAEIEEIQNFYVTLDDRLLKNIYYRMLKEKSGSGIIPVLVSSAPLILLVFSNSLQKFLFKYGMIHFVGFSFVYLLLLTFSVLLHFHERAWAAVHIEIIQGILKERSNTNSSSRTRD